MAGEYHRKNAPLEQAPAVSRGTLLSGPAPVFHWPARGQVAVPYGTLQDGVTLRGMIIKGSSGADVVAAAAGRVSFVDPHLKGYGKTLILEHSGEFHTVYARVSEILVRLGEQVRQGQVIAKMGDGLYFEIRKKSRPQPPQEYLLGR